MNNQKKSTKKEPRQSPAKPNSPKSTIEKRLWGGWRYGSIWTGGPKEKFTKRAQEV